MTLGALEQKFWAAWCRGAGREDLLGEHSLDVLRAAGYDEAAIARLVAAGVVGGPPPPGGEGSFRV